MFSVFFGGDNVDRFRALVLYLLKSTRYELSIGDFIYLLVYVRVHLLLHLLPCGPRRGFVVIIFNCMVKVDFSFRSVLVVTGSAFFSSDYTG